MTAPERDGCPSCGHSPLRSINVTDFDFGDCKKGHAESECGECGWNSGNPDGLPCPSPGCGADLRHRDAITHTAFLDGRAVGSVGKRLQGDGSRYSSGCLPVRDYDRTVDTCASCGTELGSHDWPKC